MSIVTPTYAGSLERERLLLEPTVPLDIEMVKALIAAQESLDGVSEWWRRSIGNLGAGASITNFYGPADGREEWLVDACCVEDTANVDLGDQVGIALFDNLANATFPLIEQTLVQNTITGFNYRLFPVSTIAWALAPSPLRLRNTPTGDPWRQLSVTYKASATIGTRVTRFYLLYRRRLLK